MYPNEARLRDLTYQSEVYANILVVITTKEKIDGGDEKVQVDEIKFNNVKIGAFPIMLHSKLCCLYDQPQNVLREMGECPYDQGGYFIIDGKEKVIVAQERIALNKIFINKSNDDRFNYEALVRCTSEDNPLFPKTIKLFVANDSSTFTYKKSSKGHIPNSIILTCPNIQVPIPVFVIFRALGIESDEDIIKHVVYDIDDEKSQPLIEFLRYSVLASNHILTQKQAFEFLQKHVEYNDIQKVKHVLINDFFPNMGNSFSKKAMFLGHILNRLVKTVMGITNESDRDNYVYKRVDISGFLIGNLFRDYYNQFRNTARSAIDKEYLSGPWKTIKNIVNIINKANLKNIFRSWIVEDGFRKSLKGSWGKSMTEEQQDADDIKEGLVQDLARISYMGYMSHLRRVNTPIDPTSKIVAPHRLHPSQWGIMCPIESPDGASIGLLKHFAIFCNVTFESGTENVLKWLKGLGVTLIEDALIHNISGNTKILINSNWVGVHNDAPTVYKILKLLKRNGLLDMYVSISWDIINMEINISTEAGRCCRPLYIVNNGKLLIDKYISEVRLHRMSWWDLVTKRVVDMDITPENVMEPRSIIELEANQSPIEYLDVEETNCSMIAMDATYLSSNSRYTHCEIHPSVIFGVVTQNIPLLNHNQAPRNIFFGAQAKQAVGMYATNFNRRIDTMAYVLNYPQKQLVSTRYKEYLKNNVLTGGENLIVAIATWTGYNQEDSIIINKSAIERGMFNMTYFKNIIDKESENNNENERIIFNNPVKCANDGLDMRNIKFAKFKTINDEGMPILNKYLSENDAIFGKTLIKTEFVDDVNTNSLFNNKVKTEVYYDKSMIADKTVSGIVDKVFLYTNSEGMKSCKLRLRKTRVPELGDKMAAVHGQKGVVGMILPPEEMPFNKDGITPDIIINPHAFPTRMTIGQLFECVLAKTCVNEGMMLDATPFNKHDYTSIYDLLETKYGLDKYGNEMLYNGRTGEQIQTEIFIGPTYYMRLKHMVGDKINYRRTGPRTVTTRQPTQGRGNNGGLRIGEMERDSVLAHGLCAFLKESLMERSDKYEFDIENSTGNIAITNKKEHMFKPQLDDGSQFSSVSTPYAFKLLLQEIFAMGIKPSVYTRENEDMKDEDDAFDDNELYDLQEDSEEEHE
jgi:DNA-directed RNA polymerase II subunit RPB2